MNASCRLSEFWRFRDEKDESVHLVRFRRVLEAAVNPGNLSRRGKDAPGFWEPTMRSGIPGSKSTRYLRPRGIVAGQLNPGLKSGTPPAFSLCAVRLMRWSRRG